MKKMIIVGVSLIAAMLLSGCSDESSTTPSRAKAEIDLSSYPMSELSEETKYTLAYMWNEERLAYDLYNALHELYVEEKTFVNIATKSESKHIAWVEELVERYDINITNLVDYKEHYSEEELRKFVPGEYNIEAIQLLYNDLYAKGKGSLQDALEVGCMVEVVDINDLNEDIAIASSSGADDVVAVFETLRDGSYQHYWAFDGALKNIGITNGCYVEGDELLSDKEGLYPKNVKGKGGKR